MPRLLAQTRDYCLKEGRGSPLCLGQADIAFFTSQVTRTPKLGWGMTKGRSAEAKGGGIGNKP